MASNSRRRLPRPAPADYPHPALALALVVALLALFVALRVPRQILRQPDAAAAEQLYAIALPDAQGHVQALAQWRGKLLVVNFWATWCAPCVAEMPELDRLERQYAPRNVAIVGVGVEDAQRVRQFRDRLGLHMPLLVGGYEAVSLARNFGDIQGVLPYTALLSTKGEVLRSKAGALDPGELQEWVSAVQ